MAYSRNFLTVAAFFAAGILPAAAQMRAQTGVKTASLSVPALSVGAPRPDTLARRAIALAWERIPSMQSMDGMYAPTPVSAEARPVSDATVTDVITRIKRATRSPNALVDNIQAIETFFSLIRPTHDQFEQLLDVVFDGRKARSEPTPAHYRMAQSYLASPQARRITPRRALDIVDRSGSFAQDFRHLNGTPRTGESDAASDALQSRRDHLIETYARNRGVNWKELKRLFRHMSEKRSQDLLIAWMGANVDSLRPSVGNKKILALIAKIPTRPDAPIGDATYGLMKMGMPAAPALAHTVLTSRNLTVVRNALFGLSNMRKASETENLAIALFMYRIVSEGEPLAGMANFYAKLILDGIIRRARV